MAHYRLRINPTFLPSLTVNQFASVTGAPLIGNEWSTGERRVIYDSTTGDLCWFVGSDADANWRLYTSQNNGTSWSLVQTVTTGGGSTYPNRLLGVAQDSTGKVHACVKYVGGSDLFGYTRFVLTRSGGHVTGMSVDQAPFSFTDHNHTTNDHRGNILVVRRNGAERVLWTYGCGAGGTEGDTWTEYAGVSTTLTPASLSDFSGFDGTGSETAVYTYSGDVIGSQHLSEAHFAQIGSNEDLYLFVGRVNGDHRSIEGLDADQNLKVIRFAASSGTWTAGATTTIATGDGDVPPMILDVKGTSARAWIMYYDPAAGIKFGYMNTSGTLTTNSVTTPANNTGRAAFGAFQVYADDSKIWAIWHTYWLNSDQQRLGGYGYWNGSTWNTTTDSSPQDCNGIATTDNWPHGLCAVRWTGALLPQSMSALDIATIYGI